MGRSRLDRLLGGSDILRRLASLSGWTLASFAVEKGASILLVLILARSLGAADFGRLVLAQGLVNTLQIVVVLGAGAVLARYVPAFRRDGLRRVVEVVSLCGALVLFAALVFVATAQLAGRPLMLQALSLDQAPHVATWVIGWVVLSALGNILQTVLLSLEQGRALGVAASVVATVSLGVAPAAANAFGLSGAVAALAFAEVCKIGVLVVFYGRLTAAAGVPMAVSPRWTDIRLLGGFGVPVFLTSALWAPTMWLGQLIISQRAPDGLIAVGVFGFANSALGAVILLSTLTNRAAMPIYASLHADGRHGDLRRLSGRMALIQLAVSAAIAVPICLGAPWIMALAGPAFGAQWPVLVLMILTGVVIAGQTALGNYLLVTERQVFLLGTMVIWAVLVLAGALAFATAGAYALSGALLVAALVRTAVIGAGYAMQDGPARSMNSPIRGS